MLTIHHLGLSQSERIVWLAEEMGLEYDFRRYARRSDNRMAPDEYKALTPMGIAPVITDGDLVLGESGAIIDYMVATYPGGEALVPSPGNSDFADHLFWFHFANGTFMTNGMMQLMLMMADAQNPMPGQFVATRTEKAWDMVEQRLGEADYFGGAMLSTADIMMGYGLTTARLMRGTSIEPYPNIRAYLQRIGERPAYIRAMAKAEPGMAPKLD